MKKRFVKLYFVLQFVIPLFFLFTGSVNAQEEKSILSKALIEYGQLKDQLPTKDRIAIYESVLDKYNKIISDYPATDTGLTLLSTGKFGTFDFKKIQSLYIVELSSFYEKTCEVNPSAICQGFVALLDGTKFCAGSGKFADISMAHRSLLNAMLIFKEQDNNDKYYGLSKNLYLQCDATPTDVDAASAKDFFNFELIKVLIKVKDATAAKGLIERLKSPYYKLVATSDLKRWSGEQINAQYITRLLKYVNDQIINEQQYLQNVAKINILNLAMSPNSIAPINIDLLSTTKFSKDYVRTNARCEIFLSKETYEQIVEMLANFYELTSQRGNTGNSQRVLLMQQDIPAFYVNFGVDILNVKWIDACGENYILAIAAANSFYSLGQKNAAQKYLRKFDSGSFKNDILAMTEYYLDLASDNKVVSLPILMRGVEGDYATFKKMVDIGDICAASKQLYEKVNNTKYRQLAVKYMASVKDLYKNKKQECGDTDLELLLK